MSPGICLYQLKVLGLQKCTAEPSFRMGGADPNPGSQCIHGRNVSIDPLASESQLFRKEYGFC